METAPEDTMEGLTEEYMCFVPVCCHLPHLRRGWGKCKQPHVYQVSCAPSDALSQEALIIRFIEGQAT